MKLLVTVHKTQVSELMCSTSFINNVLGIYLLFNRSCYPNGSYINHNYITLGSNYISHLQCVLPNSNLSGGEWVYPNLQPVNCNSNNNSDPLHCIESNNPANITVYRPAGQAFYEYFAVTLESTDNIVGNEFKCCLPSNCSDPTTNIITVHIFSKLYLIVLVHTVICF